jgi:peptide/nickel transport system ATP-binding protein
MNTLEIRQLTVDYAVRRSSFMGRAARLRAVDHVDLDIAQGTTLALVGESGSGKTTVARAILGLVPAHDGQIRLDGIDLTSTRGAPAAAARQARRRIQMVFQQPSGSLDPRMRVGSSVAEPMRHLSALRGRALRLRVLELLDLVGLDESYERRFPRHLSGGQRERVAIARAIAISPSLVICDEPTSALDVSVQAQVLNLLVRLQAELHLSYLFISHDLAVVRQVADTVAVINKGSIVESGPADRGLGAPQHAYTIQLLEAVPSLERALGRERSPRGSPAPPVAIA